MNGSETSKVYNFTMKSGYNYVLKIYTTLKSSSITGNLDYTLPVMNTKSYYVGGLRLKQKTIYDPPSGVNTITTYSYSAATFKQPSYTQKTLSFALSTNGCGEPCAGAPAGTNTYDVKEYTTLSASYGGIDNEVNYSEVTTLIGASGENGKTITRYTPYNNDYFWRKGNMDEQQFYNASGKLLKKVVNHYITAPGSENIQGLEVNGTFEHPCLAGQPQNFSFYTKYANFKPTFNPSEWFYMDTTTTYDYDSQNSNVITTRTVFSYQNPVHMQLNQSYTTNSQGKSVGKYLRYPLDYTYNGTLIGNAVVMKELTNRHIYNKPIEEVNMNVSTAGVLTTDAVMNTFQLNNNQIVKDASFRLKCTSTNSTLPAQAITNYTYLSIPNGTLSHDYRYEYENQYTRYDLSQNLLELKQRDNTYAFICPSNGDLWAKTTHATYNEIAYSSFDHENVPNNFTNWNYNNTNIFIDATAPPLRGTFNGTKCYKFPTSTTDIISNRINLNTGQQFKVSFWGKGGIVRVTVSTPGGNLNPSAGVVVPLRTGPTRMGWTYYEGYFTNASLVEVAGTGMIDELRLHPASARMETYVYKQGLGIISKCNENNQNTFWSFDEFQRLRLTTDQDGYILNKNEYYYQQVQN